MRTVELHCCLELQGKKFCSGGSVLTNDYVLAYLSSDGTKIETWHGQTISSKVRILNTVHCSNFSEESYYLRFRYRGSIFSGFALCKGGIVKAKKTKMSSLWS